MSSSYSTTSCFWPFSLTDGGLPFTRPIFTRTHMAPLSSVAHACSCNGCVIIPFGSPLCTSRDNFVWKKNHHPFRLDFSHLSSVLFSILYGLYVFLSPLQDPGKQASMSHFPVSNEKEEKDGKINISADKEDFCFLDIFLKDLFS